MKEAKQVKDGINEEDLEKLRRMQESERKENEEVENKEAERCNRYVKKVLVCWKTI